MLEHLARLPHIAVLLIGLALIAAIAWLNLATGPNLVLDIVYLLPVMFVAWVTASTAYGLLAVLATFFGEPLEAYLNDLHTYPLPVALWNVVMRMAVFCIVLLLLAKVRRLVARLQEQSLSDQLTGVGNRRALVVVAARAIEHSRRYQHELSLAYLDIDGFKAINDCSGHAVGDRVLIALAGLVRATTRSVDTVVRIGGDEFVILMPETDAQSAWRLAERLRAACSRMNSLGMTRVTCSVGLVTFERPASDLDELLTMADRLMYEAKAAGGDCVQHASVRAAEATAANGRLLPFARRYGA